MLKEKEFLIKLKRQKYIEGYLNLNLISLNLLTNLKKHVVVFIMLRVEEDYFVFGNIFFKRKNFIIYNKVDKSSLYFYYFSPFIYSLLLF